MSNLLVQNIKHTNNTSAQTIDTSGRTTVSIINNDSTYRSDDGTATQNLVQSLCKGFVCVDVSAGAAFSSDDSFNIGSVTDNGTGNFGLTFTNNMATVRYNSPGGCYTSTGHTVGVTAEATTGTQMRPSDNGGSGADVDSYMAFIGTMA